MRWVCLRREVLRTARDLAAFWRVTISMLGDISMLGAYLCHFVYL
jgi:hypothetical protein